VAQGGSGSWQWLLWLWLLWLLAVTVAVAAGSGSGSWQWRLAEWKQSTRDAIKNKTQSYTHKYIILPDFAKK
jgi:hypothetical protein